MIRYFFFWLTLFFIPIYVISQVNADFEIDDSIGCAPHLVNFTNLSTGTSLSYSWDFDNGNSSEFLNPSESFNYADTFWITLTAYNTSDTNFITKRVIVYPKPEVDFTAENRGCSPFETQFFDGSTSLGAPINYRRWDFRNGTITGDKNPVISYPDAGIYDVILTVRDTNGCENTKEAEEYVEVVDPPEVSFEIDPPAACDTNDIISFLNTSDGEGQLTWLWKFGDGKQSTLKDPIHRYSEFKTFIVSLEVTSDFGCSRLLSKPVSVRETVIAEGNIYSNGEIVNTGDTICSENVIFDNFTSATPYFIWLTGDKTTSFSYIDSFSFNYNEGGKKTIELVVNPNLGCENRKKWEVHIIRPQANFTLTPDEACVTPVTVNFNATGTNIASYEWTFSDNTKLIDVISPQRNIEFTVDEDDYALEKSQQLVQTLKATDNNGCPITIQKSILVNPPTALFRLDTLSGCAPLTINATDISLSDTNITNRLWFFGGEQQTGNQDIAYTFNNPGEYDVRLRVTDAKSCIDTSYAIEVVVGENLNINFNLDKTDVCTNESFTITDISAQWQKIDKWKYVIGTHTFSTTERVLELNLVNDPENLEITQFADYNGCISQSLPKNLTHKGPMADFDVEFDCEAPLDYQFINTSSAWTNFNWSYDGNNNTDDVNLNYSFASAENYTVSLSIEHNGCVHSKAVNVPVRIPETKILTDGDTIFCANQEIDLFTDIPSFPDNLCLNKYQWHFYDSIPPVSTNQNLIKVQLPSRGEQKVRLVERFENECTDTAIAIFRIKSPLAGFTMDTDRGCNPLTVNFTDISTPDLDGIKSWEWLIHTDALNFDIPPGTFDYDIEVDGDILVKLTVIDSANCSNTFTDTVYTASPNAFFEATDSTICFGDSLELFYGYTLADSAIWDLGDGNIIRSLRNPFRYQYADSGSYDVVLTVYSSTCSSTSSPHEMRMQIPDASYTHTDTNCYPALIRFDYQGIVSDVESGRWYFGDKGNNSAFAPMQHYTYTRPGTFKTALRVQTSFGCVDSVSQDINITGPYGTYSVEKNQICISEPAKLQLNNDTSDVFAFEWFPGNGERVSGNPIYAKYSEVDDYFPTLILYGDEDSICKVSVVSDSIFIFRVNAAIGLEDTTQCAGRPVFFPNNSIGNENNRWAFGDGTFGNDSTPSHTYKIGDYDVSLVVWNSSLCYDTAWIHITVDTIPVFTGFSPDTAICQGDEINIHAAFDYANQIRWYPHENISDTTIAAPSISPVESLSYFATIIDTTTGCDKVREFKYIVQPPAIIDFGADFDSIVVGNQRTISTDSIDGNRYYWEPHYSIDCDSCVTITVRPLETTTYVLHALDTLGCFDITGTFLLKVNELYVIDVPTAFLPEGSEANRVALPRGYGYKYDGVYEFSVYNRWGNRVFYTDDVTQGWDGTFKGEIQPADSYVWFIKVEMWNGEIVIRKGTITLIR